MGGRETTRKANSRQQVCKRKRAAYKEYGAWGVYTEDDHTREKVLCEKAETKEGGGQSEAKLSGLERGDD